MSKIEIDISKDMERALENAFPGEDKAGVVIRLIECELGRQGHARAEPEREFEDLVQEVFRLREQPPYVADEDIGKVRDELRR